jgi:RNA-directed DNA polymerase
MRPLGIPAIRDRIVQEALRMVLEPIWEADFSRHSYSFRPDRSTKDAVAYIGARLTSRNSTAYGWVVEGDIQSFFDTIDHRQLMQLLRRRIKDRKVLSLIWKFLRAGIMEEGTFRHSLQGTPQGGIRTPPTILQTFFQGWDHPGVDRSGTPPLLGHGPPPRA